MSLQLSRFFEIVQILLNNEHITAKKLAEHFEVSVRTIYRDIETLISTGVPIYCEKGRNGGIRLLDNYIINKSLISEKEQNEILYALQSLKAVSYSDNMEILQKLNSIFNKKTEEWIEIDFSRYGEDDSLFFENIKKGIINKNIIEFEYCNTKGIKSKRRVEPFKLWFKEKAWYLFAYCLEKNDIRQFKVTRMRNLTVSEEKFERKLNEIDIENREEIVNEIKVVIEIDKTQAYRVYDEFCEEDIRIMKNGNFEITMKTYENTWLYGYLLSFGEFLKVVKPVRIKKILFEKVEKMKENFL